MESGPRRHLVDICLPLKERPTRGHLWQHAADRPHVDGLAVHTQAEALLREAVAEEELGGAVPARGDVVRVCATGAIQRAREPKVAQLEDAVPRDEDVLGLHVAVHDAPRVAERDGAHELVQVPLHHRRFEPVPARLELIQQRPIDEFEHEVQLLLAHKRLHKLNNVVVLQLLRESGDAAPAAADSNSSVWRRSDATPSPVSRARALEGVCA